tara:strand:+ start:68162 stop:69448 length:1287 start_codon:yes stop_codon:yes gene_type:complete
MNKSAEDLKNEWSDPRWKEVQRDYSEQDVVRLRGTKDPRFLAEEMSDQLHKECQKAFRKEGPAVRALGAVTGNQAIQMTQAGLRAVYASGWQVAADNNLSGQMYPDLSLYANNSMAFHVQKLNNAMIRADQIEFGETDGKPRYNYVQPIVADAEAGFGGVQCTFEVVKGMIEAGAAGVHLEDQLSSEKKCGHLGGKVLVPTSEFIEKLKVARLAADVVGANTVIIARTDANSAKLMTSDIDDRDKPFLTGESQGQFYGVTGGLDMAIARGLAYAPYADMVWVETARPDLEEARQFATAIHDKYPHKMLAYNCSPSFNWESNKDRTGELSEFQNELAKMGYVFQFITLAGFHSLNTSMYKLAHDYKDSGMAAYSTLQEEEFALAESDGYKAVKHQGFVGTGYYDDIKKTIGVDPSTSALAGSTETEQFH